jgi:hypothetical protein
MCPLCEAAELEPRGHNFARCASCDGLVSGPVLETLRQIAALPDALGAHACECGHPEMRRLHDGTFHCPSCGSEVLPLEASGEPTSEYRSSAYWAGWIDGHFGEGEAFTSNRGLAQWQSAPDRLDYYRGHRDGQQLRTAAKGECHEEIED